MPTDTKSTTMAYVNHTSRLCWAGCLVCFQFMGWGAVISPNNTHMDERWGNFSHQEMLRTPGVLSPAGEAHPPSKPALGPGTRTARAAQASLCSHSSWLTSLPQGCVYFGSTDPHEALVSLVGMASASPKTRTLPDEEDMSVWALSRTRQQGGREQSSVTEWLWRLS